MQQLFTGMLLIFFDFNLTVNTALIGLVPDFVGYIFIYKGLLELTEESPHFKQILELSKSMVVIMAVIYLMNLFSITASSQLLTIILGTITTAITLYTIYHIVRGVLDIEISKNIDLFGEKLFSTWKAWAILSALATLLMFVTVISTILLLVGIVMAIIFLVTFYKSKNQFYALRETYTSDTNL
ncbi:hypothetical protein [Anaerotignum sp. MB30-C6]|uniref:hypothetical protein n=1 Tax=Anaerotignum sp. MB30-C6 TaxID=3070814 RepID=UPI0027DB627B|nr:hypothetical protein [Anaerotignum sp. MB30-C6]WMI82195.1 hypothetical protein RBQ60_05520 [Anaerotignum sp. MB30-C6]